MVVTSYGRNKIATTKFKKNKRRPIIALAIAVRLLIKKKQTIKVKMPPVNRKPLTRKGNFVQTKKLGLESTMNRLGKPFRKKNPSSKKQNEIAACEHKKSQARKRIFVQTPFSYSTLKLERKNFTPQNHSLFCSTSSFGVTKITTRI